MSLQLQLKTYLEDKRKYDEDLGRDCVGRRMYRCDKAKSIGVDAQRSTRRDSGGTSNSMLRSTSGLRRIRPFRCKVTNI
jgi:hypothetical protein